MTIQKYDWVSKDTKLNANGWCVPLNRFLSIVSYFPHHAFLQFLCVWIPVNKYLTFTTRAYESMQSSLFIDEGLRWMQLSQYSSFAQIRWTTICLRWMLSRLEVRLLDWMLVLLQDQYFILLNHVVIHHSSRIVHWI